MTDKYDEDGKKLWRHVTKDVEPLDEHNDAQISSPKGKSSSKNKPKNKTTRHAQEGVIKHTQNQIKQAPEIDHRTSQRLKRGQISIDGRIDLHGMTQNQAYDALLGFIPSAYDQGKRCVLVITGKGGWQSASSSLLDREIGILKQKTPEWLNEAPLSKYVLKIQTARPNHGGDGALYVLLRRKR